MLISRLVKERKVIRVNEVRTREATKFKLIVIDLTSAKILLETKFECI